MKSYSKAIAGALVAAATALAAVLPDGVTAGEWLGVFVAAVTGFGGVYAAPKNAEDGPGEDGAVTLAEICLATIALVLVLGFFGFHGHH